MKNIFFLRRNRITVQYTAMQCLQTVNENYDVIEKMAFNRSIFTQHFFVLFLGFALVIEIWMNFFFFFCKITWKFKLITNIKRVLKNSKDKENFKSRYCITTQISFVDFPSSKRSSSRTGREVQGFNLYPKTSAIKLSKSKLWKTWSRQNELS